MFECITNNDDRGQVGIGTLIVFIAMVLVAAIAAGVLINTAGFLQSQAEATGEDSTDLVSERLDVTSSVGIVEEGEDPEALDEIRLTVAGSPGADNIDLRDTTLQAVGPDGQENLVFAEIDDEGDVGDIGEGEFAVKNSDGEFVDEDDSAVVGPDDQFTIVLDPNESPFEDDGAFPEGSQSSIDIVSPAGATTSVDLRAPDLYNEGGEAVRL